MTRSILLVALLAVVVGISRLGLERAVAAQVRLFADDLGIGRYARFEEAVLDPPFAMGARDLRLVDAETDAVVAHLDSLDVVLDAYFDEYGFHVALDSLTGRGGRAEIDTDAETILDVPFIRAITGLVVEITDLIPDEVSPGSPVTPPLRFLDIEVVVHSDDYPLLRYPGADATITYDRSVEEARVEIDLGPDGGVLVLVFGDETILRVESHDLRVGPSLERILGMEWGAGLARGLAPKGRLDLDCSDVAGDAPVFAGVLREASIHPPFLPVAIDVPDARFELRDGRIIVPKSSVGLPDGGATISAHGDLEGYFEVGLDVHETAFRKRYLELVPALEELGELDVLDEGSFDLELRLRWGEGSNLLSSEDGVPMPTITGSGGLHVAHLRHVDTGIVAEDLVGSFVVRDERLELTQLGARLAGGHVEGSGSLGIEDGDYEVTFDVLDVDLERLHLMLHPGATCGNDFAGTLQGDAFFAGMLDDLHGSSGFGQASARAGRFMETNLFTSIFRRASVDGEDEVRDDQGLAVIYELRDRTLYLDTLGVDLGSLGMSGSGTIGERGNLDLQLVLVKNPDSLVGDFFNFLQRNLLLQVRVEGSINEPEVNTYPVAVITRSVSEALRFFARGGGDGEDGADGD